MQCACRVLKLYTHTYKNGTEANALRYAPVRRSVTQTPRGALTTN